MPQIAVSFHMDVADDEDFTVLNLKSMIGNQMRRLLPCSSHLLVTEDGVVMSDHRSMTDYPLQFVSVEEDEAAEEESDDGGDLIDGEESKTHFYGPESNPRFFNRKYTYKPLLPPYLTQKKSSERSAKAKDCYGQSLSGAVSDLGLQMVDKSLINRVQRLTSRKPHILLSRGVYFVHRDFDEILDAYEKGDKFYLYTGMRPSQNMHLGDLIPLMFARYLQDAFMVPLIIQLTDDEKCMLENLTVEESKRLAWESAKDIIACGFDIKNTFIFSDFRYVGGAFYENMVKVGNCVTYNKAVDMFGFTGEDHVGKVSFPLVQAVPTFRTSFPFLFSGQENLRCLISCRIDQDPIFRMTRNVAPRLGYLKPALIESSFVPALQEETEKMSANDPNSAIYLTDSAKDIMSKMDDPFKYISFFMEDDEYDYITSEHMVGRMSTSQVKHRLIQILAQIVEEHCAARAAVTDEVVEAFMKVRHLPQMPD